MVALAAVFAAAAAYAAYCSLAAFRWGERKRFWLFLGATLPIGALAIALLWIGIGYPRLDQFADNMGFGPEWNCSSDAMGAGICLRKPRSSAPARPSAAAPKQP